MADLLLKVPNRVKEELDGMAAQSGLSVERLVTLLLQAFVEGDGKIYSAPWREGPGIRMLPDWPRFSSKVFEIKQEEMK